MSTVEYSVAVCNTLKKQIDEASLYRPMQIDRYDVGDELVYEVEPVANPLDKTRPKIRVSIDRFVGGGFAGQVYKVKVVSIDGGSVEGIEPGSTYAMKILIPPSKFSIFFRNLLYWIGFQGPFQLQCNPAAARAGALWQKLIRRAARVHFGTEDVVNNVHATFVDPHLGSCGEISDWVDGRTWRLEVDDHLDVLAMWQKGKKIDPSLLGSPEYRSKRQFMREFVRLLNQIGAYEFARQYEWSTCKSQPNCLKKTSTDNEPLKGLIAVDFRAGLALLPLLPMSPGDVILILKGLARGSLVQFDRGNIARLEAFINKHSGEFQDLFPLVDELKKVEEIYRNSIPDITHNHIR
ncbi:MAG: hypothetical protein GF401_06315, partial [Chitinivibrionales bacterium]|nr:hypothetical protein [Chitinivibrionales bacterium]